MFNTLFKLTAVTSLIIFLINSSVVAQSTHKSTGIGFRGSFFNPSKQTSSAAVSKRLGYSVKSSVNAGGCLYVFSRISERALLEFSLGSIASIEQELTFIASQKVNVFNITPILFGIKYDFLQSQKRGILQPYLSAGFGVYFLSEVEVTHEILREDVVVSTNVEPGLYLGGGLNIHLESWIALNFDGKYHLVKVNPNYHHSGFEFGIGFNFSWGIWN